MNIGRLAEFPWRYMIIFLKRSRENHKRNYEKLKEIKNESLSRNIRQDSSGISGLNLTNIKIQRSNPYE